MEVISYHSEEKGGLLVSRVKRRRKKLCSVELSLPVVGPWLGSASVIGDLNGGENFVCEEEKYWFGP